MNTKNKSELKLDTISFTAPHNGYAPAEDSWLLAHTIEKNKKLFEQKHCLDMGCGNGIQTAAMILNDPKRVTCIDINEDALRVTHELIEKYFPGKKSTVNYVHSFLFEKVNTQKFDTIVFNPPYVPSEKIKWVEVDGGKKGREIIDSFLDSLRGYLTHNGMCLLLQTSLNSLYLTRKKCMKNKLSCRIIARQKLAFEELQILKITSA